MSSTTTSLPRPPPAKTTVAHSIHDAVQHADIIFTIIATDAVSIETVSTALQAARGLKGKLWVESSTADLATVIKLAAMVEEGGGDFLAMSVFGAAGIAIAGQLVCVPAGPKRCINKFRPFLDGAMGVSTIDMSD